MKIALVLFLLASSLTAQSLKRESFARPFGPLTIASTSTCVTGQSLDIISSTGYESNALLRSADGRMNRAKAIPLKIAPCLLPLFFERKLNRTGRIAVRVAQFTFGVVALIDANHNFKNNR